jgi:alkaline phosphatase D
MTAKSRSAPISCLDVRFDGLPKFCKNEIDGTFSKSLKNGTKELRFSMGEREQFVSCEPGGRLTAKPKLGMPGPRAIRVWVRTDATRDVKVVLAESEEGDEVASATARPQPQDDFTATLKVHSEKIMSNKTYYYRVLVDDNPQTRWIPARTAGHLKSKVRIAMGSCAKGPIQPVYDGLIDVHERQGLDAMLYLGDNFYGDRSTLDGHRFEYRTLDAVEQRANFLMQVPSLATWDDHDFVGNNSDGLCTGKEEALKGFKEAWPNPSFGTDGAPGTFTSAKMGPLDVFMLDCRSYRPRNYSDRESRKCDGMIRDVTLPSDWGPIGKEQYRWLMESLQNSNAPFKLIACGSLMTGDSAVQRDSWGNFPEAQRRFFNDLKGKNIRGVVLAAGDIHRSEFRKYERSKTYPVYEFVASPLSLTHANGCGGETDPRRVGECYAKGNSFISVEVNGAANDPKLTAIIHDADGKEKNRLEIKRSEL